MLFIFRVQNWLNKPDKRSQQDLKISHFLGQIILKIHRRANSVVMYSSIV